MAVNFDFGRLHREHRVSRVLLVHGTLVGDDPFGVSDALNSVSEMLPLVAGPIEKMAESIRQQTRPFTARLTGDVGNYTAEFQREFERLTGGDPFVELLEPAWSSQNHHLARADLAVRLLEWLISLNPAEDDRILLWGHSHAGNAFALLTNLLANNRAAVEQFFEAVGPQPENRWQKVRRILAESETPHPIARSLLIATFGTPVRYGWDTSGYRALVHVLHHREPADPNQEPRNLILTEPLYPPHPVQDVVSARYGDWVQAFAIAGTDFATPTASAANDRLGRFLEASLAEPEMPAKLLLVPSPSLRRLCARWMTGTRCHADGRNLLVDYTPTGLTRMGIPLETTMLGHGVATSIPWLPVHLQLITESLIN